MEDYVRKEKRHIVKLVTSNHSPYDTRIFEKEAKSLADFGYRVSIIIPHTADEVVEGVSISAVDLPGSGWEKLFITPLRIMVKALMTKSVSCFHIHDAELLLPGIFLKLIGYKVIYDAHEDTPQQLSYQHWIPALLKPLAITLFRFLEWLAGVTFDAILVAEPIIAKYFPTKKTFLLRNFPVSNRLNDLKPWNERRNQVVYIGAITEVRGFFEMLQAFSKVKKGIDFVLGGAFSPRKLQEEIKNVPRIHYLGWLRLDMVYEVLGNSKLGLIMPHPIYRYLTNFPVKLFEYMLAGLPVIVTNNSMAADFVIEGECGFIVNPFDEKQVLSAINEVFSNEKAAQEMGERGRALILKKYNWETESLTLERMYKELLAE
jgi:glycosyltransferase involved in cell wall biosynthesis